MAGRSASAAWWPSTDPGGNVAVRRDVPPRRLAVVSARTRGGASTVAQEEIAMFCPQCRTEYQDNATRCTECGSALVGGAPPAEDAGGSGIETVCVFESTDIAMLSVVESLLQAEQIPFAIEREPGAQPFPGVEPLTGRGAVRVPVEQAEAAKALIADRSAELAEDVEPADPGTPADPTV
jgi:hypothetical protein